MRTLGTFRSTRIGWAIFTAVGAFIVAVFLGAGAVQAHSVGDWCAIRTPRGISESRTEWTWFPPEWNCVYMKRDRRGLPHDVARRRAFSE